MEAEEVSSLEEQIPGIKSTLAQLEQQTEMTEDMRQLKADLLELLEISEQRLLELKKKALLSTIQSLEEKTVDSHVTAVGSQLNDSLIGQRCAVPHWSANGVLHRQNAIICGVDPGRAMVRVLLSAPTRPCDLPCPHFLAGEDSEEEEEAAAAGEGSGGCGRNGASCKRSHGLPVNAADLSEFREPDLARLKLAQACLVKLPGRVLWLHARVAQIDAVDHQCVVDLRNARDADGAKSCAVKWEDMLPLESEEDDDDEEEGYDWSSEEEVGEEEEEVSMAPRCLPEAPSWERHSTGFASRLMAQMGYEPGRGLGANGDGRLEPVPIEVLPAGASLDHVMKLRERRRAREERKEAAGGKGGGGKERAPRKDVFSFLNHTLSSSSASASASRESASARNKRLSASSLTSLGAQLLAAEKEVTAAEQHLVRLTTSLTVAGAGRAGALRREEAAARERLDRAREAVRSLERHKAQRQERRKLTVF